MADDPKFFSLQQFEGISEILLGTADFVTRPIIVLAKEEITQYVDEHKPERLVISFENVSQISTEFITALIDIQDHVTGHDGTLKLSHMNETVQMPFRITKLAGRVFKIYDTTPKAIEAF